jgi:hypothetical protein
LLDAVLAPREGQNARHVHLSQPDPRRRAHRHDPRLPLSVIEASSVRRPEGSVGHLVQDALEETLGVVRRCEAAAAHPYERLPVRSHLPIAASEGLWDVSALERVRDVADHHPGVLAAPYLREPHACPHPRARVLKDPSQPGADLRYRSVVLHRAYEPRIRPGRCDNLTVGGLSLCPRRLN